MSSVRTRKQIAARRDIIVPRFRPFTEGEVMAFAKVATLLGNYREKTGNDSSDYCWGNPGDRKLGPPLPILIKGGKIYVAGSHKYSTSTGYADFCEIVAEKLFRESGVRASPDNVFATYGATFAFDIITKYSIDEKSAVFTSEDLYPPFKARIEECGGKVYAYNCFPDGQPDTEHLQRQIKQAKKEGRIPKFVYVNSPNNPTGDVYHYAELKRIKEIARENGVFIVSDDVYFGLVTEGNKAVHLAETLNRDDKGKVAVIWLGSFSKEFMLQGDRLGWACLINCEKIPEMQRLKNAFRREVSIELCAPVIAQELGEKILLETAHLGPLNEEIRKRAVAVHKSFGLEGVISAGTFYAWLSLPEKWNDVKFAYALAEKAGIGVAPGTAFWVGEGEPQPRIRVALTKECAQIIRDGETIREFMRKHERMFR